jgi:hypothetical protein
MKRLQIKLSSNLGSLVVRGGKRLGLLGFGLAGIGLVTYLSLRSSPAITTVNWIPKPIAQWADRHGRFCNLPAYGVLATPFLLMASTFRRQMGVVGLLALLILAFELLQLRLPARSCDPWDIAYGWAGLLIAWGGYLGIKRLIARRGPESDAE